MRIKKLKWMDCRDFGYQLSEMKRRIYFEIWGKGPVYEIRMYEDEEIVWHKSFTLKSLDDAREMCQRLYARQLIARKRIETIKQEAKKKIKEYNRQRDSLKLRRTHG